QPAPAADRVRRPPPRSPLLPRRAGACSPPDLARDPCDPLQPAGSAGARPGGDRLTRAVPTLVQAEALAAALGREDLAVVDCRHSLADPQAGAQAFAAGHVPGAVHAHMDRDLSGTAEPGAGAGRHPWPDAAAFCARLGAWGI